ncbi:MAG: hypothetical protein PHO91_00430 [Patescibacteria group bacterium]|nr:hypothetical protein [Patescibacteria group bacterium]
MFEHLSPSVEARKFSHPSQLKLYLPFLFLAFFIFIFIFSATRGPAGQAVGDPVSGFYSRFISANFDLPLAKDASNVSLFDFVLENNQAGASLYKLKVGMVGVYDLDLIDKLQLYHGSTQLGAIKVIDESGSLHFQLADYFLPAGQNHFSLRLVESHSAQPGTLFNFIIADRADVALKYKGTILFPDGDFPAESGLVSFLEQGYLAAFVSASADYFLAAGLPQSIASFSLVNYGESADLGYLRLIYQGDIDLTGRAFALVEGDRLLSEALAQAGAIEFFLEHRPNINQPRFFEVYALDLPAGNFSLTLAEAEALAYYSGQNIKLNRSLFLSDYQGKPYYLEVKEGVLNTKLLEGWNKVYELDLRAIGQDPLFVHKLSWQIDYADLAITDWELWLDSQPIMADFSLSANELTVKADWNRPWPIAFDSSRLALLAKIKSPGRQAFFSSQLLTDKKPLAPNSLAAYFIWSAGNDFFSSLGLPYLPLLPSVLSK